jgi:hypothetical protein
MHVKRWMQTTLGVLLGSVLVACGGTGDGNVGELSKLPLPTKAQCHITGHW